jgi:hypothetical protein
MADHTDGPMELVETDDGHQFRIGTALRPRSCYDVHHVIDYNHGLSKYPDDPDDPENVQFEEAEANARRIVALWNACQGLSTRNLEAVASHGWDDSSRLYSLSWHAGCVSRKLRDLADREES